MFFYNTLNVIPYVPGTHWKIELFFVSFLMQFMYWIVSLGISDILSESSYVNGLLKQLYTTLAIRILRTCYVSFTIYLREKKSFLNKEQQEI